MKNTNTHERSFNNMERSREPFLHQPCFLCILYHVFVDTLFTKTSESLENNKNNQHLRLMINACLRDELK